MRQLIGSRLESILALSERCTTSVFPHTHTHAQDHHQEPQLTLLALELAEPPTPSTLRSTATPPKPSLFSMAASRSVSTPRSDELQAVIRLTVAFASQILMPATVAAGAVVSERLTSKMLANITRRPCVVADAGHGVHD